MIGMEIPKPQFVDATETSIQVKFPAAATPYTLQWKAYSGGQDDYSSQAPCCVEIPVGDSTAEAVDLEPGSTYCLRLLRLVDGERTLGPELIVDTEQVGCTPQQKSGCCIVS